MNRLQPQRCSPQLVPSTLEAPQRGSLQGSVTVANRGDCPPAAPTLLWRGAGVGVGRREGVPAAALPAGRGPLAFRIRPIQLADAPGSGLDLGQ
jgi:hypothetical protein